MSWIEEKGFINQFQDKYTKWDIADLSEVKQWATYMALRIIFEGASNSKDDVYIQKMAQHTSNELAAQQKCVLRIDLDKDGRVDKWETLDINSVRLYFR